MTIYDRYAAALQLITDRVGILRTRAGDIDRLERHGVPAETRAQLTAAIERLERVARDLEKAAA